MLNCTEDNESSESDIEKFEDNTENPSTNEETPEATDNILLHCSTVFSPGIENSKNSLPEPFDVVETNAGLDTTPRVREEVFISIP